MYKIEQHLKKVSEVLSEGKKNRELEEWRSSCLHDKNYSSKKKAAFTLAEVLITLGVIGVVATITLPTVINNFRITSWENSLKKSYATITNGFHAIAAEYDGDLRNSGIFDDIDDDTFSERIDEAVRKHFNVIKSCKIGDTTNCKEYKISDLKGNPQTERKELFPADRYVIYLADGSIIAIKSWEKCTATNYHNESKFKHDCAGIYIDTNGQKSPNVRGKDVFQFELDEKGDLYASTSLEWSKAKIGKDDALNYGIYWKNAPIHCGNPDRKLKDETRADIYGQNCTARIMENGWRMDYLH